MKKLTIAISCLAMLLGACVEPDSGSDPEVMSKAEARELGGKSDRGRDFCEEFGWYGDGICDDFCPSADSDCSEAACQSDADCPDGYCESYASCLGVNCPPPPPSQCVAANCDDGSTLDPLCDVRPVCAEGEVSAIINGCFTCVDARSCEGSQPDTSQTCGGLAGLSCPDGQICAYPAGTCGLADGAGTCVPQADVCPAVYDPVCGCDGRTYGNSCEALAAGMTVDHEGECAPTGGQQCGGFAGLSCPDGQICSYPAGTCGLADGAGTCVPQADVCPAVYEPVCGCDGTTYSNSCAALNAGVTVDYEGECGATADACGTRGGVMCAPDEYCSFAVEDQCGAADQGGTCQRKPQACTQQYDPVCGCDGNTYGNACMAASAGVSVASDGACN